MGAELAKRVITWVALGVALGLASLAWKPMVGDGAWTQQIYHGELLLVAGPIVGGAVGYASVARLGGWRDVLRVVVIMSGLVLLVMIIGIYGATRDRVESPSIGPRPSHRAVAAGSERFFGAAVVIGLASTYLTFRSDSDAIERGHW